jgi:aminoglycoside phosphotransferase (APT) family kinase protein
MIAAILDQQQLGHLKQFSPVGGNIMNAIYDIHLDNGQQAILKVQVRTGGSVEAEHRVIEYLRAMTSLPVSKWSILDTTCSICAYPYVIFSRLSGQSARVVFEASNEEIRQQLVRQLGHILGVLHSQPLPPYECLGDDRPAQWRSTLEQSFFHDEILRRELSACVPTFYPRLIELLGTVSVPAMTEEVVLLWKDPAFHNMLVANDTIPVSLSGIFDFQFASIGSRTVDLVYVEEDFARRSPREIYGNPAHVQAFKAGYEGASGCGYEIEARHRILQSVMMYARAVRNWWEWGRLLHPKTPFFLDTVLDGLSALA